MTDYALPTTMQTIADDILTQFCEQLHGRDLTLEQLDDEAWRRQLQFVWACSDFVAKNAIRYPEMLLELVGSGDLERAYDDGTHRQKLLQALAVAGDEVTLMKVLRQQRRREMVRIAWRDIAGLSEMSQTTRELSWFADACIDETLNKHYQWLSDRHGIPHSREGEPQQMVVLGMGKLGAHELNFSSDIDLIFTFPERGETRGEGRCLSNEEFFRRLGQKLIQALDNMTEDGQVFRVDMRLRPFGDSGPLVVSFAAMEEYYQLHGREWERYAMVKARVVAGDQVAGQELMDMLRPFVYRRYIDYGVFESLREMKGMIMQEVARKGLTDNVKLGAGGIREIEFIGQAFQLIRGGRDRDLQIREITRVLEVLVTLECLPVYVVRDLAAAYEFLRNTEHRIQEYQDKQSHDLPVDDAGRERLAVSMGFISWNEFYPVLWQHRLKVQSYFEQVVAAPQAGSEGGGFDLAGIWLAREHDEDYLHALGEAGFSEPDKVLSMLFAFKESRGCRTLSDKARQRFDQLMPMLLGAIAKTENDSVTMERVMALVETVTKRSAYISLLVENPMALSQLVKLCSVSSWISHYLQKHPMLLDELLDPRSLYAPPDREGLQSELEQRLNRVDEGDLEQQMEILRHFKQSNVLRVAAADISHAMPLMVVSDHLSWIAEVILQKVADIAWNHMVERHGSPMCRIDDQACDIAFAVVAYGKLGGIELGYGSDLDLVFLHAGASGSTAGDKPLDNSVFFMRLGQRIIHIITAHTPSGVLYEADMRLRPSGASGLLVSSVDAFAEYQREKAWTWEHQALVRARVVVGDAKVQSSFERVREEILCQKRDPEKLRAEVQEMREKMREHLLKKVAGQFDLKQAEGGIADIEFMVQYGVLSSAHDFPQLCRYTDNIRILQMFGEIGLMSDEDVNLLCDAYRAYRAEAHRMALLDQPAMADEERFSAYLQGVSRIWHQLLMTDS